MSGRQTVTVTVVSGDVSRTGSATFELRSTGNPTIQVGVSPGSIAHGATAMIQPVASGSACGGEVRVACTSNEGIVNGTTFDSSNIAFDPNDTKAQSKNVTITCTATDTLLAKASANATLVVTDSPHARRLDDIVFAKDSARVNNCGKRLLLEEATAQLRENPDWTLVLVGHRDEQETGRAAAMLDANRAMNAAAVLSAGKGICPLLDPSRLKVIVAGTEQSAQPRPLFCGTSTDVKERSGQTVSSDDPRAQFRRVEVWMIPSGSDIPAALKSAAPVNVESLKTLGCPK
jgi:outer membrane protein OmpA-like peptidoglycan-associated protein